MLALQGRAALRWNDRVQSLLSVVTSGNQQSYRLVRGICLLMLKGVKVQLFVRTGLVKLSEIRRRDKAVPAAPASFVVPAA